MINKPVSDCFSSDWLVVNAQPEIIELSLCCGVQEGLTISSLVGLTAADPTALAP